MKKTANNLAADYKISILVTTAKSTRKIFELHIFLQQCKQKPKIIILTGVQIHIQAARQKIFRPLMKSLVETTDSMTWGKQMLKNPTLSRNWLNWYFLRKIIFFSLHAQNKTTERQMVQIQGQGQKLNLRGTKHQGYCWTDCQQKKVRFSD